MDINEIISKLIKEKKYDEVPKVLSEFSINFWSSEYPQMTFDEKVSHWSGRFGRQMRWNGESGYDEFAIFSFNDYCVWKKHEPLIDDILPHVLKKLSLNKDRIYELIKNPN